MFYQHERHPRSKIERKCGVLCSAGAQAQVRNRGHELTGIRNPAHGDGMPLMEVTVEVYMKISI
jgi:hypothetical protein